jgi:predicted amidophosphoribosyltransferase
VKPETPLESAHDGYGRRPRFAEEKLNRIARAAGNFFFPSRCLACRSRPVERFLRGGVCETCWEELPEPAPGRCDVCDEALVSPGPDISRCGRCLLSSPSFRRLRAAAPYRGSAREILIAFKFGGADFLAPRLARIMTGRLGAPEDIAEITAVPATARDRRRGDHAADLLGAALAARLGLKFSPRRLEKVRPTERQSGLPLARRAENVRRAFRARPGAPERILIVDDVATSGATARECARLLLQAGAREVDVWCFARASRDDLIARDIALPARDGPRAPDA